MVESNQGAIGEGAGWLCVTMINEWTNFGQWGKEQPD
jgi:hypothetical protein